MKLDELLALSGDDPLFGSSLLTDRCNPAQAQLQLSRWHRAGKIIQIRKKLYCFGQPYRKREPHPFYIARRLKPLSYVSLYSALAFHGIAQAPPEVQCITLNRPERLETPFGSFLFRRIKKRLYSGYNPIDVRDGQQADVASAEKALLDLLYLVPHSDNWGYRRNLNLDHIERLQEDIMRELVEQSGSEKLRRAARKVYLSMKAAKRNT